MRYEFTVEIARDDPATTPNARTYSVRFRGDAREPREHLRRCRSDYALLRLIEDLVGAAAARLALLERLRTEGHATIPQVVLTGVQAVRYGLASFTSLPAGDPLCPVCLRSVRAVERLVFRDGEAIHDECRLQAQDVTDEVARFLDQAEGRALGHTCLSSLFSISFDEARKVVGRLHVRQQYAVAPTGCSACHKLRVVIRALPAAGVRPDA